jgi:ABC-type ATPase involved in cell division
MTEAPSTPWSEDQPIVRLRDVRKAFGDVVVLDGISFDVMRGETVCIIGPSGSGKSTLLRCINALVAIDAGSIRVRGQEVNEPRLDKRALRRKVGMVFQQYNLFPHRTALQNVMMAPVTVLGQDRREVEERARRLMRKVRLDGKEHAYPGELSGGQQQRVAIARSLAMNPVQQPLHLSAARRRRGDGAAWRVARQRRHLRRRLIIAIIGFIQEGRAERALEAVRGMLSRRPRCCARAAPRDSGRGARAGRYRAARRRRPGAGRPAADSQVKNLQRRRRRSPASRPPVEKRTEPVAEDAELGDRACIAYSGTVVTAGQGSRHRRRHRRRDRDRRISGMLSEVETLKTPLMQRLDAFTKVLSVAIIGLAVLTFRGRRRSSGGGLGRDVLSPRSASRSPRFPRAAGGDDDHPRDRRPAHGAAQRDHPAPAGGRDARLGHRDLLGQDRHADAQRDDRAQGPHRGADIEVEGVGYAPTARFRARAGAIRLEETLPWRWRAPRLLCNDASCAGEGGGAALRATPPRRR